MAKTLVSCLQAVWPFSLLKGDDLHVSNRIVQKLPIPDSTKQFTFAIQDPSSKSVVFILAVQNLSEQSSLDAESLIKSVQPDAVVLQIAPSAIPEIKAEERISDYRVPTSTLGVLKKSFLDKINKREYENVAGNLILKEIFGVGFYGHLLAAKRAAETVNSHFLLLNSPYENIRNVDSIGDARLQDQNPLLVCSLAPRRYRLDDLSQLGTVRSLSSSVSSSRSISKSIYAYQAPWFARTVYSLLADLHGIFADHPAIDNALVYAQKMLADVDNGENVDTEYISEVQNFRIAVEGLRIALNSAARAPHDKMQVNNRAPEFDELSQEEKCHVLLTQGLKHQTKKFKTVVAIIDAGCLSAIRRHWNTDLPPEVMELAAEGITRYYDDEMEEYISEHEEKKKLLSGKPVVAVGAGATAFISATSFSKAIHASNLVKIIAYKLPISLKMSVAAFQRMTAIGLAKLVGPSKILASGVAGSTGKASALKVTASTGKIRALTHSIIVSGERTSLLAMHTSFYEIMRKGKVRQGRVSPWFTLGCSMVTCTGLLAYGDGIECAAELAPSAPMVASLGRGLQSLHDASLQVTKSNTNK
ncbi:uncharacterized protein LOC144712523 [Wolffia australiana]